MFEIISYLGVAGVVISIIIIFIVDARKKNK